MSRIDTTTYIINIFQQFVITETVTLQFHNENITLQYTGLSGYDLRCNIFGWLLVFYAQKWFVLMTTRKEIVIALPLISSLVAFTRTSNGKKNLDIGITITFKVI